MSLRGDIGPVCREKVLSLEDWLKSIEDAGLPLSMSLVDEGENLMPFTGPAITEPAPLVHITKDRLYLDGLNIEDVGALERELTDLIELRRSMMPESPFIQSPTCHLAIDNDVRWEAVVATVAGMSRSGITAVTFVFRDPVKTVPAPPASPIDGELARMQKSAPMRRGQIIAEMVAYVYQDCPEGLRVIASMGVNPIADFKQVILDALPEAIGQCACAPDDASVKALHWALFGNPRPSTGITVAIAPLPEPLAAARVAPTPSDASHNRTVRVIAHPGEELWEMSHRSVVEAAQSAQFVDTAADASPAMALLVSASNTVDTPKSPKEKTTKP
jgi:hypothetical protein